MSYSKDLIFLFGVWDCAQKPHSLSDDQAKIGCITSTCKRAEQDFPLSNMGVQVSHWTLQPPQIFPVLSRLGTYLGMKKTQGTSAGENLQEKSCALGLLQMIGFGVPSSCLQCISTGLIVLVWKLRKWGTHSQGGHHGAPKLELQG
jgi:hypothetical protein